jgi:enoyl-CoA hydratase/carnithine racemase
VGRKRALELLLFGDLIDAHKALDFGFVNKVVPLEQLSRESREWAATLAQKSPLAVQMAKKAFYMAADMDYYKAFEYVTDNLARLCTTEDCVEGIHAFMEKRQPQWKER